MAALRAVFLLALALRPGEQGILFLELPFLPNSSAALPAGAKGGELLGGFRVIEFVSCPAQRIAVGGMEAVLVGKSPGRMRFQQHRAKGLLIAGAFLDLALGGNGEVPLARQASSPFEAAGQACERS